MGCEPVPVDQEVGDLRAEPHAQPRKRAHEGGRDQDRDELSVEKHDGPQPDGAAVAHDGDRAERGQQDGIELRTRCHQGERGQQGQEREGAGLA